ncbi:MAG: hypothetical protein Q8R37_04045 [Nanoarchaeota archaeon]|nr:hypothetical protein [Nanoarchaeota archaeon]
MFNIKPKTFIVLVLFFILAANSAVATVDISENQLLVDVNYASLEDDDALDVSMQLTLNNPDAVSSTVQITFSGLPSGYQPSVASQVTVPANGTTTVPITVNIPHREDSGEKDIGFVIIKDTSGNEVDRVTLRQRTASMIKIKEFTIDYTNNDGSSETDSFDGNDINFDLTEDIKSGTEVMFTFDLENLFDKDYDEDDGELTDITVTIDADDNDIYQNEIPDEYNLGSLANHEETEFTVNFRLSDDADAGIYSFDITLEADDGKDAKHTYTNEISFNVERVQDDVRITAIKMTPEPITTCTEQFNVDVNLKNFGTQKQSDVRIALYNAAAGIDDNLADIIIDKYSRNENEWKKVFQYSLKDIAAGSYPLDVTIFINDDEPIDYQRLFMAVEECAVISETIELPEEVITVPEEAAEEATEVEMSVTTESSKESNKVTSSTIVATIEDPYTSDDILVSMLVVAIVTVLATVVIFSVILFKKK